MAWKLKQTDFGLELDVDIKTQAFALREIYNFKLDRMWRKKWYISKHSKDFIQFAVKHLPEGSFISFSLDVEDGYDIQFAKVGGYAFLDFTIMSGDRYRKRLKELEILLDSMGFRKITEGGLYPVITAKIYAHSGLVSGKNIISANFGKDYKKAASATFLIGKKVYGLPAPFLSGYSTGELQLG